MDDPDELDRPDYLNEEAEGHVFLAKLNHSVGRFGVMLDCVKNIVGLGFPLTDEERNLLLIAYETLMAQQRSAWRVMKAQAADCQRVLDDEEEWGSYKAVADETKIVSDHYRIHHIAKEFKAFCEDMAKVVRGIVIPVEERNLMARHRLAGGSRTARPVNAALVYYKKLLADSYRYMGEMAEGKEELESAAEAAEGLYNAAKKNADSVFGPAHPVRLGVMLNMSIFYYDVMQKPDRACKIASIAFREGQAALDSVEDESEAADASMVLLNLRDNMRLWAQRQMDLVAEEEARLAAREERRVAIAAEVDEEEAARAAKRAEDAIQAHLSRARKGKGGVRRRSGAGAGVGAGAGAARSGTRSRRQSGTAPA